MKIILTHSEILTNSARLEIWTDDDELIDVREKNVSPFSSLLTVWTNMLENVEDKDLPD